MSFSYTFGNTLTLSPKLISITKVKHGVTEVSLSDGRIMRLTLHLEGVAAVDAERLEVSYQVITEVMSEPELPILDVHEQIQ